MSCMMRWRSCALAFTRSLSRSRSKLRFSNCSRSWMRLSSSAFVFSTSASERTKRSISAAPSAIEQDRRGDVQEIGAAEGQHADVDQEVVHGGRQRDRNREHDALEHEGRRLQRVAARARSRPSPSIAEHHGLPGGARGDVEGVARDREQQRSQRGKHDDAGFRRAALAPAVPPHRDRRERGERGRADVEGAARPQPHVGRHRFEREVERAQRPERGNQGTAARTGTPIAGGTRARRSRAPAGR